MWSWSKLATSQSEGEWNERVSGNPNAVIEEVKGKKMIRVTVYCEEETEALLLKECFGGAVEEVTTVDWVAAQEREKRPELKIRDALVVTEESDDEALAQLKMKYPKRVLLSIPAEMAFGTGDHATTSTCLRMLCDFAKEKRGTEWAMTDIGCGTAVLAMAAVALGADHATAFDFDPVAVEVSQHNATRNGWGAPRLEIFQADVFEWVPTEAQRGDLVVANLFSTVLQRAFPKIIESMKSGATLVISGILASQWEETRLAGEECGLSFDRVVKKGKWVTARGHLA
jgi:ribosomal protein L11 methyltransferase